MSALPKTHRPRWVAGLYMSIKPLQFLAGSRKRGHSKITSHTEGLRVGSSKTECNTGRGSPFVCYVAHKSLLTYTHHFTMLNNLSIAVNILLLNTSAVMKATLVNLELGRKRSLC